MALVNGAVIKPGVAHVLLAPVNTVAPTTAVVSALTADNPTVASWDNFGHTSLDNDFAPFMDGGDSTVEGSRQNPKLRESVETSTEGVDVSSMQVTSETLNFYYGGGTAADGSFQIPTASAPIERAALVVYFDGNTVVAEYHSRASIRRSGPIRNTADGFLEFPIRFTWLQGTNPDKWIGDAFDVIA
jgi:hypothetical protein